MYINYIYCSGRIPLPPYVVVHCLPKNDFEAEFLRLFFENTVWKTRSREALYSKRKDREVLGLDRGFKRSPRPDRRQGRGGVFSTTMRRLWGLRPGWTIRNQAEKKGRRKWMRVNNKTGPLIRIDFYVLFQSFGLRHCVGRGSHTLWEDFLH